jgi:hypothetical protein
MSLRTLELSAIVLVGLLWNANLAWGIGFELGESKDELKLKYDVKVTDHSTGRVTLVLTIADEGRLKPLDSVDLQFPSKDGTGYVDLSVALAVAEVDGQRVARVHVHKDLIKNAEFQLRTTHLDGKPGLLEWYYHRIPFDKYLMQRQKE